MKRGELIGSKKFAAGIAPLSPEPLPSAAIDALYRHYQELVLWNLRLALIGPGTEHEILSRHYGEALAALPLIPAAAQSALDVGSGAGFPGMVIAAARPALRMHLAEAQERKWSFLVTAARKASLPCRCLNVRVASPLPAGIPASLDLVTVRALRLEPAALAALTKRLTPEGRILLWAGERDPEIPSGLAIAASLKLAGGQRRRILALRFAGHPICEPEHS
jgi:16S rRNA (guanine527-N7)-methyltransferase